MRPSLYICLSLALVFVIADVDARRVRVRPVASEEEDQTPQQIEYYTEQEDANSPVLVSRQDAYGRATGQPRLQPRAKHENKQPPVQTIRNYNKLNDDGSFTFGYEAADGSFKEETRGTDCVVRGKYGYIDPDGNKREFTYVSGNPCDPNAVNQEEEDLPADSGEDNVPQNFPRGPIKPLRPHKPARPATTLFQQTYSSQADNEEEEENVPIIPSRHTPAKPLYRPSYIQPEDVIQPQILRASPTPARHPAKASFISQPTPKAAIRITPRPATVEPATTYRPQLLQVTPSPTPSVYTKQYRPVQTTAAPINFDDEFKKFQLENNVVSSTTSSPSPAKSTTSDPIYSSELVFDPASGQYNTVLFQQLPQTVGGEVNLKGKLQPYVETPFSARPYFAPQRPLPYQQQLFQQQQAALFQQSQQLFQQQQQRKQQKVLQPTPASPAFQAPRGLLQPQRFPSSLLQQEPQQFTPLAQSPRYVAPKLQAAPQRYQFPQAQSPVQSFYYVSPQSDQRHNLAAGQIDAFLRGHSISI